MKLWLNDLNIGDKCYAIYGDDVVYCEVLGDARNMNYRMPRMKMKILNSEKEFELFVNTYVYDNVADALDIKISDLKTSIGKKKSEIDIMTTHLKYMESLLKKYNKERSKYE